MRILPLLIAALLTSGWATPTEHPTWTISLRTVGPVRIGSTIAELRRAVGRDLEPGQIDRDCGYAGTRDGQVYFYTSNGRVTQVTVFGGASRTRSGVGVGATSRDLSRAYPGRLIDGGQGDEGVINIVYVPQESQDQGYRIVFQMSPETRRVDAISVGMLPDILEGGEGGRCYQG